MSFIFDQSQINKNISVSNGGGRDKVPFAVKRRTTE